MPYIGKQLVRGQNRELDDISSSFNGATTTFNLTVAGDSVTPGSALQLFISIGGVLQNPNTDFTVAGNQITFSTAPGSGLSFFGYLQGDAVDFNTPADGSVTTAKLGSNLTINVADGSAATPSIQFNGSGTDTGFYSPAADEVAITTGGTGRLVIDSSGNVGIGTTSPGGKLVISDGSTTFQFDPVGGTGNILRSLTSGGSRDALLFDASQYVYSNGATEYARIDSSGRLLVGTSTSVDLGTSVQIARDANNYHLELVEGNNNVGEGPAIYLARARGSVASPTEVSSGDTLGYVVFRGYDGSTYQNAAWIKAEADGSWTDGGDTTDNPGRLVFSTTADGASSPTERMRITSDGCLLLGYTSSSNVSPGVVSAVGYANKQGTNNAPSTNTFNFFWTGSLQAWIDTSNVGNVTLTSDYRIKKNIETQVSPAIPRLKQLRPVTYERANYKTLFNEDGVAREGFIAHELAEIIPSAVEGEKDAEDQIQSINIDALVSVLTKALQEAVEKIETLEAKVAALEAQ